MTPDLSEAQLEAACKRFAALDDPEAVVGVFREYNELRPIEKIAKARLAEIDGGWLLDEIGGLRRPLTASQLAQAKEEFASMESEAIVRELVAEWYFFHPDILPLADARLAELDNIPKN